MRLPRANSHQGPASTDANTRPDILTQSVRLFLRRGDLRGLQCRGSPYISLKDTSLGLLRRAATAQRRGLNTASLLCVSVNPDSSPQDLLFSTDIFIMAAISLGATAALR